MSTDAAASARTADVTAFADACEWTGVRSNDDRRGWLAHRKTMITASDVAAIMGADPHRSALDVYVDKRVDFVPEKLAPWDPRVVGFLYEQPLLREVADYLGWRYRAGGYLLRSRKHPIIGATLDAEVDRGNGVWCDFEGKTTELVGHWDEDTGEMPERVLIQVQTQLLVTGAQVAIVFALLRRYEPVRIEVHASPALHEVIVEHCEWFMDLVQRETAPAPDPIATAAARRALHKLYPVEDGAIVDLPAEAVEWTHEYQEISRQLRDLGKRKRHLQNLLKASLGSATYGLLPETVGNKSVWRWQTQEREAYAVEETEARVLLAVKRPPPGARYGSHPAELAPPNPLERALAASITHPAEEALEPAPVIRFSTKGRRRR